MKPIKQCVVKSDGTLEEIKGVSWWHKAQEVIAEEAFACWQKANTKKNGKRYKKHRPYSLPDWCNALVEACGQRNEARAKAIMLDRATLKFFSKGDR